jgi:hypothetical protein
MIMFGTMLAVACTDMSRAAEVGRLQKNASFSAFPYTCPEPVLANLSVGFDT